MIWGLSLLLCFLTIGCRRDSAHFVTDPSIRKMICGDFERKQEVLKDGNWWEVFQNDLTTEEREALMFLYAYMPLGDVTDYDGDFYLQNLRSSLRARKEMSWGKEVPEAIFRHFVLPVRVNNENMDHSRTLFFDELKDRVRGLSMQEAALEVNHWCHEKVVYAPSDARTSAPLASVRNALGRCGEESVFTVAALRALCIPARQVYTPRWAHTDDNHAWVEVWVEGRWCFMGACEPEPVLDKAWFNASASRGMLMHARVFGRYIGEEEIMDTTHCFTEINVTTHYAPTARAAVTVINPDGSPIAGADVEFKLYNYAEFYTVAHKVTDEKGQAFLTAGKGDLLVWVRWQGRFGLGKLSFGKEDGLCIVPDKRPGDSLALALDMIPPPEEVSPVEVSEAQARENLRRLAEEDALRNRYTATFYTPDKARALARELKTDGEQMVRLLVAARGNWPEIEDFLRHTPREKLHEALALLEAVSEKDLRDAPASVLADHLHHTPGDRSDPHFPAYVLNPRIADERLSAYKSFFRDAVPPELKENARKDPQTLARWFHSYIATDNRWNPQTIPMLPSGVWKARVSDTHSRNIGFVALLRAMGVAARIEPVTGKVEYALAKGPWVEVDWTGSRPILPEGGRVKASYTPTGAITDPVYFSHFTLAQMGDEGTLQTLRFEPEAQTDMGSGSRWSRLMKDAMPIDEGNYLLITGTRMAKGHVLAQLTSFRILPGRTTEIRLRMREDTDDIQVLGSMDAESVFQLAANGEETTILQATGRGYFVLGILGIGQEPTNHALRDLSAYAKEFEAWNRPLLLLFPHEQDREMFRQESFGRLPSTITWGVDAEHRISDRLASMQRSGPQGLPVFVIADSFGRIVFFSQGYRIGLGAQMLQTIGKL
jgi:transglutaminase-like putative cysteine protease